jgi:hypothetical protein
MEKFMAQPTRTRTAPPALATSAGTEASAGSTSFASALLEAQRVQIEAFFSWQRALAAINDELWDEWICRWAGGVPIDA